MPFCDNCGFELKVEDLFCPSCGKENLSHAPAKQLGSENFQQNQSFSTPSYQPNNQTPSSQYQPNYQTPSTPYQPNYQTPSTPYQPNYRASYHNQNFVPKNPYVKRAVYAPYNYALAPLSDRFVSFIIDLILVGVGLVFCYCPGIFYSIFKDGMRNGQSFGKGATYLRVVNFNTGMPATGF